MKTSLLSLVLLALTAAPSIAGDAGAGRTLAMENCARCHNIEKGAAFKLRPPSFQAIAIYRTADDIWSRIIATSPHSGMPDVQWMLTPDQVQDLVAYITSLDTP
jgi:mono/diheme cytochrome c family protein